MSTDDVMTALRRLEYMLVGRSTEVEVPMLLPDALVLKVCKALRARMPKGDTDLDRAMSAALAPGSAPMAKLLANEVIRLRKRNTGHWDGWPKAMAEKVVPNSPLYYVQQLRRYAENDSLSTQEQGTMIAAASELLNAIGKDVHAAGALPGDVQHALATIEQVLEAEQLESSAPFVIPVHALRIVVDAVKNDYARVCAELREQYGKLGTAHGRIENLQQSIRDNMHARLVMLVTTVEALGVEVPVSPKAEVLHSGIINEIRRIRGRLEQHEQNIRAAIQRLQLEGEPITRFAAGPLEPEKEEATRARGVNPCDYQDELEAAHNLDHSDEVQAIIDNDVVTDDGRPW